MQQELPLRLQQSLDIYLISKILNIAFFMGLFKPLLCLFQGPEFPLFKKNVIKNILPFFKINESSELDRHFINVYLSSINYIKKAKFPIYGVVERTGSTIYIRNLLFVAPKKRSNIRSRLRQNDRFN